VDHELSVPAVSYILLSCAALAVAVSAELLISPGLTRQAHAALVAAGPLGTGALLESLIACLGWSACLPACLGWSA
jgi:hypothetical protein